LPRLNEFCAGIQGVKKARATGGDVESPGIFDPQFVLHQAGG
jgi:hypothetical protein